jgi:hypothetical protein
MPTKVRDKFKRVEGKLIGRRAISISGQRAILSPWWHCRNSDASASGLGAELESAITESQRNRWSTAWESSGSWFGE